MGIQTSKENPAPQIPETSERYNGFLPFSSFLHLS